MTKEEMSSKVKTWHRQGYDPNNEEEVMRILRNYPYDSPRSLYWNPQIFAWGVSLLRTDHYIMEIVKKTFYDLRVSIEAIKVLKSRIFIKDILDKTNYSDELYSLAKKIMVILSN